MNKFFLVVISVLIIASLTTYYVYTQLPSEMQNFDLSYNSTGNLPEDISASSEITQFFPNMRFNHNQISYKFHDGCSQEKIINMENAFSIISEKTKTISFYNTNSDADIEITCSEEESQKTKNTFVAGEGGPTEFYNNTIYPLIVKGTIILYKPKYETSKCSEPIVELHELLHVFGFEHLDKKDSIMYPYLDCNQKLDDEFIEYLVALYSIEPKAELEFKNLNASKSGKYLDFNVSVENRGIIDAEKVSLKISSSGKEIKSFDLEDIEVGLLKTLSVKNLVLLSRNTNTIIFEVILMEDEYDKQNNIAVLNVLE